MMSERRHSILGALQSGDDVHRVVRIWPRCAKAEETTGRRKPIHDRDPNISSILSLAKYERDGQEDDYRHRVIINGLALVVTVALIAIGVWLAANIHD
jgi:hypothetical protein